MNEYFEVNRPFQYARIFGAFLLGLGLAAPALIQFFSDTAIEGPSPIIEGMIAGTDGRMHYPPPELDLKSFYHDWVKRDCDRGIRLKNCE